jgi:hypothetical protein
MPGFRPQAADFSAPPRRRRTCAAPARRAAAARQADGVDKELEEKARKAEDAEKARQAAEVQKVAQAKAENCKRRARARPRMDSGMRVARLNAQGEREIMDDKRPRRGADNACNR